MNAKYINRFLNCNSAEKMLRYKLYPNAKEITEAFAAFDATTRLPAGYEWNNPEVTAYCVGDGVRPRAAMMFALRTAWTTYSIDPRLSPIHYPIQRLTLIRKRVEEVVLVCADRVLIVAVHSHAPLTAAINRLGGSYHTAVIAIPCCIDQSYPPQPPDHRYRDEAISSPMNEVLVWEKIRC